MGSSWWGRVARLGLAVLLATPAVVLIVDVPAAHASETYQHIVASHSDKCLNVPYASQSNDVQLIQYTCPSTATNDRWIFEPVHASGIEAYRIRAMHSKKCLNVSGASHADGAPVIQYTCVGGFHPTDP
jgi:Ricin-type beta-trefoil lectin domain-like